MNGWFGWQWLAGARRYRARTPRSPRITALALLLGLTVAFTNVRVAAAQTLANHDSAKVRVGFSNLVARLDTDEIGFAKAEYRVHILEALRKAGFNAVGAESLVFGRDDGGQAELVLGGTVHELECRDVGRHGNCRVGIKWELLDVERDTVVYRVLTRHMEPNLDRKNAAVAGRKLTLGALADLISRPHFAQLLGAAGVVRVEDDSYRVAGFRACTPGARELPADFNVAADATFLIKQADGFGSGFSISPDGLVLTAAHVVSGKSVELTPRGNGSSPLAGTVVRISHKQDVALIAIPSAGNQQPCLELQPTPPPAGADVYAIGSPARQDLAFSLTRGIVSGLRLVDGVQLVQTDASLSPGNSGGPLLDRQARVVGVVTRKIAGRAVEGLGFGVQIQDALQALKLQTDRATASELLQLAAALPRATAARLFEDTNSPVPSLDPEGDRRRALAADKVRREKERADATPWLVKPLRIIGVVSCIVGATGIVVSTSASNDARITHTDYVKYRSQNDVSWGAFLLGAAAVAISYPLEPRLATARVAKAPRAWSVGLGLGQVRLGVALYP